MNEGLTGVIEGQGDGYVGLALSWDNGSQGMNVSGARENLKEAIELFCKAAPAEELQRRLHPGEPSFQNCPPDPFFVIDLV